MSQSFMAVLLLKWLPLLFMHCLFCSYLVECSVSQPESVADCDFPKFSAPPFPPTSFSNYPLDPWTPKQVLPPGWVPNSPLIPWMPRQLVPPLSAPAQIRTPVFPGITRQPHPPSASSRRIAPSASQIGIKHSPPSFIPEQTNSPRIPRQLFPPPLAPAQVKTPAQIISSPYSPGESSTGTFPQAQSQSGSSSSFRQLQFGQQPFLFQGKSSSLSSRAKTVGTAVGVTFAVIIIAAGTSICLILRCCSRRRRYVLDSEVAIVTPSPNKGAGPDKSLKGLNGNEKGQAGVRLQLGDKKSTVNALVLEAPKESRPSSGPQGRTEPLAQTDGNENLKSLQREKISVNQDHPTKHNKGSLSYDGDMMEAMFGSVAIQRRTFRSAEEQSPTTPSKANLTCTQIVLLEPRRSQNIANILRSVKVSRQELLDALYEGKGLNADTLGKLSRITPTKREESLVLAFRGHPPSLAHAESFLYHTMKSVPLAFSRINAMLFRLNYQTEIQYLDEHLCTLEKGCNEIRESVLLFKLIEAALRAGNERNAEAVSGAAHSFNLASLWKLFDIQSTDGKSTIIQSVVEGVAIAEGKQCVLERDTRLNLGRRDMESSSYISKQNSRKFMILGLPLVSGLSAEFPNTKKAAAVDNHTYFLTASSTLAAGLNDIQDTIYQCNSSSDGGFVTEMKTFLEKANQELSETTEEQVRVIQLVKRTTEYYQSKAPTSKEASPFQIFSIVKAFLDEVDQACIHLSENLQRRKKQDANTGLVLVKTPSE